MIFAVRAIKTYGGTQTLLHLLQISGYYGGGSQNPGRCAIEEIFHDTYLSITQVLIQVTLQVVVRPSWDRAVSLSDKSDCRRLGYVLVTFSTEGRASVFSFCFVFDQMYIPKYVGSLNTKINLINLIYIDISGRGQLKCDDTRAENRFRLSEKRTSPFKSPGASVQSTTGSRGVRITGCNAGYNMFRESVKGTGYPLHLLVSPSLPHPCVTVCHHISTGLYAATRFGLYVIHHLAAHIKNKI